ncbi:50S ribosomal protein L9 [bacterium]|nr:50S ribosomal protein L9 [bacterium]
MKVILLERVPKLGDVGDVVTTKDGYARNYLVPKGLAIPATKKNLKQIEKIKRFKAGIEEKKRARLQDVAEKLENTSCEIVVNVDEEDHLFGSVTAGMIAEAINKQGFAIDKKQIQLDEPINSLGIYYVTVNLHREIQAKLKVWVLKSE